MRRSIVGLSVLALAVFATARARAEGASSLQPQVQTVLNDARAAEKAPNADRSQAAANLSLDVTALHRAAAAQSAESAFPDHCLRAVEIESWRLGQIAHPEAGGEFAAQSARVQLALARCAPFVTMAAPPRDAADVAEAASVGATLARNAASALDARRDLRCAGGFSVDDFLHAVVDGRFTSDQLDALRPALSPLIMQYYHLDAFAHRDPSRCDLLDKVEERFSEGWGCRQLYGSIYFQHEYMTRGPELPEACRQMVEYTYPEITAANRERICGVIVANVGKPQEICSQLIPRYMSSYKTETCLDDLKILDVDSETCGRLEPGHGAWYQRCQNYSLFKKAYKAKDPSLCGENEICGSLMGDWRGPVSKGYARRIQAGFCDAMQGYAGEQYAAAALIMRTEEPALSEKGRQWSSTEVGKARGGLSELHERLDALGHRKDLTSDD
jgi:hypothetical protein